MVLGPILFSYQSLDQNFNQYENRIENSNPVFPKTPSRRRYRPTGRCADPYHPYDVDFSEYQPVGSHPKRAPSNGYRIQRKNRTWPGQVCSGCSARKTESRGKPGSSGSASGPKAGQKLAQSRPKGWQKSAKSRPKVGQKSAQSQRKVRQKSAKSWPKALSTLAQSRLKVGQKVAKSHPKVGS